MNRADIHRPSVLNPADYEEVGIWTMNIQGFGDAQFILQERERIKAHMAKTGGNIRHFSNGACDICGNQLAIYLVLFYHEKSNAYITVGVDCAVKLSIAFDSRGMSIFKKKLADAREAQAGKRKAIAILSDNGVIDAWEIYSTPYPQHLDTCKAAGRNQFGDDNGVENPCTCGREGRAKDYDQFPERTIRDIVGKLVKYGNISPKQSGFVASLLKQIIERPIREAQRQAEKDAAGPVPTGRVTMRGEVVGMKEVEYEPRYYGDSGISTKLIIRLENGSKVFGSRFNNYKKGDQVFFTATVTASKDDAKFGFYKRPVLAKTAEEIAAEVVARKQAAADAKFIKTVAWA